MGHFQKYRKYIRVHWKLGVLAIVCVSLEALCDLFQPKLMSQLVDIGVASGDMSIIIQMGLRMFWVVALGAVFALTRNIASGIVSQNFGRELRDDLYEKILSLSAEDIDRFEGGSLITRMTNDVAQLQNFVNMIMRIFLKAPIMCIGAMVMVSTLNMHAIFLIIPIVISVFFVIVLSMRLSYARFSRMQKAVDRLNTMMREYLTGIRLVKAFRRFDTEAGRFGEANETLSKRSVSAGRVMAVFGPFMQLFAQLGIVGIIFFGARWTGAGLMEVGGIMAFIIYMQQITQSFNMISNILNMIVRVKTSDERIIEVLGTDTAVNASSSSAPHPADQSVPMIEFSGVKFKYKGSTGQPALDGITFVLARGQSLGIIGSTGSGKTSLAALLLRFYAPTGGEIKISGMPIGMIPEKWLRAEIAVAPQTATLFTGTIMDNIMHGNEDASEEDVYYSAKLACAHDFIILQENGYDTVIDQGGVNLSGGQKQRVSVARAVIRKPQILVLDDCTSALDVITEAKVRQNLTESASGMTCVIITQRIGTVMNCDRILVLDNGKAVGFGSHDELIGGCEMYRDIHRSQIGFDDSTNLGGA